MHIITNKILLSNSKTTGDIIPWNKVEEYIKNNKPELLDEEKWKPIVAISEKNDKIGFKGYWGCIVINGEAHYFAIDFFQYNNQNHLGEYFTIIALVEIDEKQNPISVIEFDIKEMTAKAAKEEQYKCNGLNVNITDADSFDDLLAGNITIF